MTKRKVYKQPPAFKDCPQCIVTLTEDERAFLSESKRCKRCGHLNVLHNGHCCSFCTLPDCNCDESG